MGREWRDGLRRGTSGRKMHRGGLILGPAGLRAKPIAGHLWTHMMEVRLEPLCLHGGLRTTAGARREREHVYKSAAEWLQQQWTRNVRILYDSVGRLSMEKQHHFT